MIPDFKDIGFVLVFGFLALLAGVVLVPPSAIVGLYWLTAPRFGWEEPGFGLFAGLAAAWGLVVAVAIVVMERRP